MGVRESGGESVQPVQPVPVDAEVRCADGGCGRSTRVVFNPVTRRLTHLVVRTDAPPHAEVLVPVEQVAGTTFEQIQLRCSRQELSRMDPFIRTEFTEDVLPPMEEYDTGAYTAWPYAVPARVTEVPVQTPQVPPGELAVRRGTRVEATDGPVGRVDEFLVDPGSLNITHLVMRKGHLWGERDVSIPIQAIRETRDDAVLLALSKQQVASLPSILIHRQWVEGS